MNVIKYCLSVYEQFSSMFPFRVNFVWTSQGVCVEGRYLGARMLPAVDLVAKGMVVDVVMVKVVLVL